MKSASKVDLKKNSAHTPLDGFFARLNQRFALAIDVNQSVTESLTVCENRGL